MSANLKSNLATFDSCAVVCNAKAPGLADRVFASPQLGTSVLDANKDSDTITKTKNMLFDVTKASCMTMCMSKPLNKFDFKELETSFLSPSDSRTIVTPEEYHQPVLKKSSPRKKKSSSPRKKKSSPRKKKASPRKKNVSPLKSFVKKAQATFKNMSDSVQMKFASSEMDEE
jgi:hypothetical protein